MCCLFFVVCYVACCVVSLLSFCLCVCLFCLRVFVLSWLVACLLLMCSFFFCGCSLFSLLVMCGLVDSSLFVLCLFCVASVRCLCLFLAFVLAFFLHCLCLFLMCSSLARRLSFAFAMFFRLLVAFPLFCLGVVFVEMCFPPIAFFRCLVVALCFLCVRCGVSACSLLFRRPSLLGHCFVLVFSLFSLFVVLVLACSFFSLFLSCSFCVPHC